MSGEIVKKLQENLQRTPSKRIGDVNILYVGKAVEDLQNEVKEIRTQINKKIDNGITSRLVAILERVNAMPCNTHLEIMKRIEETVLLKLELAKSKSNANRVFIWALFVLYGIIISGLITIAIKVWRL